MTIHLNIILTERVLIREKTQDDVLILRIVKVLPHQVWVCNINDDSWPYPLPSQLLTEELNSDRGRFVLEPNDPWAKPLTACDYKTPSSALLQKRWKILQQVVFGENTTQILLKNGRQELIAEVCSRYNISSQMVSRLLKKYWKHGMTFDSLRPGYDNSRKVRYGKRSNLKDKKVGDPPTITLGIGINATSEIREILQVGADYYLSRQMPTLKEAQGYIVERYCPGKDKAGKNKIDNAVSADAKPTEKQLRYFIENNHTDGYRKRRRVGQKDWNLNERAVLDAEKYNVKGTGDRFRIDATVADVYLRSRFDHRRIIGRPIIYFVTDVFTSLIVGMYVGSTFCNKIRYIALNQ